MTIDSHQYICPLRWWGAGKGILQISSRLYSSHLSSKTFSWPRADQQFYKQGMEWLWHSPLKIPQFDLLSMLSGQRWWGRKRMSWIQQRLGTRRRGKCTDSHGHLPFPPLPWPLPGRVRSGAEKSGNSTSCNPPSRVSWAPTERCHLPLQGKIFLFNLHIQNSVFIIKWKSVLKAQTLAVLISPMFIQHHWNMYDKQSFLARGQAVTVTASIYWWLWTGRFSSEGADFEWRLETSFLLPSTDLFWTPDCLLNNTWLWENRTQTPFHWEQNWGRAFWDLHREETAAALYVPSFANSPPSPSFAD